MSWHPTTCANIEHGVHSTAGHDGLPPERIDHSEMQATGKSTTHVSSQRFLKEARESRRLLSERQEPDEESYARNENEPRHDLLPIHLMLR